MVKVNLIINCINCNEELSIRQLNLSDDIDDIRVHVMGFEQQQWYCSKCGHTTCSSDLDMIDSEDL